MFSCKGTCGESSSCSVPKPSYLNFILMLIDNANFVFGEVQFHFLTECVIIAQPRYSATLQETWKFNRKCFVIIKLQVLKKAQHLFFPSLCLCFDQSLVIRFLFFLKTMFCTQNASFWLFFCLLERRIGQIHIKT